MPHDLPGDNPAALLDPSEIGRWLRYMPLEQHA